MVKVCCLPRATHILVIANYFPVSKNFHDFDHMAHDERLFAIFDRYQHMFAEKIHRSLPQFSLSEPMPSVHGQFCQSDDKFSYFSQDGLEANVTVEKSFRRVLMSRSEKLASIAPICLILFNWLV